MLAIRGINSSAFSTDMLILPELVSREVFFGVNPASKVYYTTDGTDPRGDRMGIRVPRRGCCRRARRSRSTRTRA